MFLKYKITQDDLDRGRAKEQTELELLQLLVYQTSNVTVQVIFMKLQTLFQCQIM